MGILRFRSVYRRIPVELRRQIVEALSNLPQQTSSSLLYTLRAPPRYWIATATDNVEPRRPDSGQHVGTEGDCRGRSGTGVIIAEKSKTNAAIAEAATTTGAPTAGEGAKETSEAQNFRRWKTQR